MKTAHLHRLEFYGRKLDMSKPIDVLNVTIENEYKEIQLDVYQSAIDDAIVAINGVPTTETTCLADRTLIVTALINLKNTIGGKL